MDSGWPMSPCCQGKALLPVYDEDALGNITDGLSCPGCGRFYEVAA